MSGDNLKSKNNLKFFGASLGIFVCYFYYGVLQEAITKTNYGTDEEPEKFTFTLSLVAVQCAINCIYAQILLKTWQKPKATDAVVQNNLYAICALTYMLAMVSSNLALQWVPYPTQVIAKSCKPIPVMLLGVLLANRSYSLKKYLFVLLIVIGVALFMYNPSKSSKSIDSDSNTTGQLLLIMSLAMDGLTAALQEKMRSKSSKPNSSQMMKMMNLYSIFYALTGVIFTGELFTFSSFVSRHPEIIFKILTFSIASALGQFFIYVLVSDFGPLPCSIVTTTRKFFTVLGSVILFGNIISGLQWVGAALVFVGLGLDAVYK